MMKLLYVLLLVIVSQLSLFSQSEVVQTEDGDFLYIYDVGEGIYDSICMIGSSSFKLDSYKIEGDVVLFSAKHPRRINWNRYKVNEKDQTCISIYSGGISRYDHELRANLTIEFEDLNKISIFNANTKEELVKLEYKVFENIFTINNLYKGSIDIQDIKYSPYMVQDKRGRVISRQ